MSNLLHLPRIKFPFHDSFRNLIAGFGIPGRDKVVAQRFVLQLLDPEQLTSAYRGDWISRKIVDVPAFDSCRAWREWQAENDEIEKIEECEKEFGLQRKLMWAISKARLYGGAVLVMGIDGQKFEDELDPESVGKGDLKFVHACTRWMITAGPLMRDITSPWYGEPTYYMRSNVPTPQSPASAPLVASSLGYEEGATIYIHPSRVVRLIGNDYPDWEMAPDQWGDSVLQTVFDAVRNSDVVSSSIATMITEAKLDVIKVPGLMEMLSTQEGSNKVFDRFSQANVAKSVVNATLLDIAEEFERKQLTFSGMDGVMSMYLMIAAGAADIPATRLLGRSPEGMNATGDSDMRNYYDRLSADQKVRITPALSRLDEVLLRHVFGDRPEDIHYEWAPLWQMDDVQKAAIALQKAQAHKIDVDNGLINPDVLRDARQNQVIEDGFYPGIEAAIDEHGIEPDDEDEQANMELDLQMKQAQLTSMKPHNDLDLKMKQAKLKQLQAPKPKVRPRDAYDPSEPRDPRGRWTEGGMHSTHPGRNYSQESNVDKNGVIHTASVEDAARALFEHRKVELNQPRQVSTLVMRLGEIAQDMVAQGQKAPTFNLCDVTVHGTNLFCVESKGIPRVRMPQLSDEQTAFFHEHLSELGHGVKLTSELASHLRATQDELNGAKVAKAAELIQTNTGYANRRIIVSKDNYVLDGHHFWAGKLALDAADGNLSNDTKINITRVDVGIIQLLDEAEKFTGGKGKKGVGDGRTSLSNVE